VLVVLTDGCSTQSLGRHDFRSVLDLATDTPDLSIFILGLDVPAKCPSRFTGDGTDALGPRLSLQILAGRTSGQYKEGRHAVDIRRMLRAVRDRLEREAFVAYRPQPFGKGPRDGKSGGSRRWRKVEIRGSGRLPCRVVSAGPPRRLSARETAAVAPSAASSGSTIRIPLALPDEPAPAGIGKARPFLVLEDGRIRGRIPDLVLEPGDLYDAERHRRSGRWRISGDREPEYGLREIEAIVPPFPLLERSVRGPEGLLLHLVDTGVPARRKTKTWSPVIVHGTTFLRLREGLARALFRVPGYHEWATERVLANRRRELATLLENTEHSADKLHRLDDTNPALAFAPSAEELVGVLAEWLGDVNADDMAAAVDRSAANARIAGNVDEAARWESARSAVDTWFPPPVDLRVHTPLVPAFEEERGVVGFYRFLLDRPEPGGPHGTRPPWLLATRVVEWLLGQPALRGTLGDLEVRGVSYDRPSREERRTLRPRGARRSLRTVDLSLVPTVAGTGPPLRIRAHFDESAAGAGPLCMTVDVPGSAVSRAVTVAGLSCSS
jgi:hypothetical protein